MGSADQVTPAVASTFRDHLKGRDLSGDRVNKIVGLCCVMFRNAGIEPNPFDGIRRLDDLRHLADVRVLRLAPTSAAGPWHR